MKINTKKINTYIGCFISTLIIAHTLDNSGLREFVQSYIGRFPGIIVMVYMGYCIAKFFFKLLFLIDRPK